MEGTEGKETSAAFLRVVHQLEDATAGSEGHWSYEDDSGKIQGPFPSAWMRAWYEDGHLDGKRRVFTKRTGLSTTIQDLFPNSAAPFVFDDAADVKTALSCIRELRTRETKPPS
jgi:hypothetical protein